MGLFEDVKARLEAESLAGSGTDWDIKRSRMPDGVGESDRVVVVTETGGTSPQAYSTTDRPRFQVRTRGRSTGRPEAYTKLRDIFVDLHRLGPTTINGHEYGGIRAVQHPFYLRTDENDRDEYAVNFEALRART